MAGFPDDGKFITAPVPDEMRQGVDVADVAAPTASVDPDGTPVQLTRVSFKRPDHIPAGPPRFTPPGAIEIAPAGMLEARTGTLQYDFPLFPAVQCRVTFQGEPTADHLDQLADYIEVACRRLREQENRDKSSVHTRPDNAATPVASRRVRKNKKGERSSAEQS